MYFSAIIQFNMNIVFDELYWTIYFKIVLGFFFISPDVNECNSTSTNTCDSLTQECENTEGSFLCNCKNGYRKVGQACEGEL